MDTPEHAPQPPVSAQAHEYFAIPCIVDMDSPEHAPQPPLTVQVHEHVAETLEPFPADFLKKRYS
jgi:hypothetical protein